MYACMCMYVYAYICTYITVCGMCMYTYAYVCIYVSINCIFNQGINLDNINVTLVPVPGQLYVYKATIASVDPDDVLVSSLSTTTSGISSFIIRVSTAESNSTTYSLLVGCDSIYVHMSTLWPPFSMTLSQILLTCYTLPITATWPMFLLQSFIQMESLNTHQLLRCA